MVLGDLQARRQILYVPPLDHRPRPARQQLLALFTDRGTMRLHSIRGLHQRQRRPACPGWPPGVLPLRRRVGRGRRANPSLADGLLLFRLSCANRRLRAAFSASNSRIYDWRLASSASRWAMRSASVMPAFYQPPQPPPEQLRTFYRIFAFICDTPVVNTLACTRRRA